MSTGTGTQLQYQKTEEQVLFDITTLYYNAQILKHQLEFLESNLLNTKKLLKNIELGLILGLIIGLLAGSLAGGKR